MKVIQGDQSSKNHNVGIVVSRFNESITGNLLKACLETLIEQGIAESQITIVHVPGAFELAGAADCLAQSECVDAVICLGAVIRGETPHFDYICAEAARGIAQVGFQYSIPAIFGVLTTDTLEQAQARSGLHVGNKGVDAALAVLEMCSVYEQIDQLSLSPVGE